jgi:hypothetical protein
MHCQLKLLKICGRSDRDPRQLVGEIGLTVREAGGRSVRVAYLADAKQNPPLLAEMWEPQLLMWTAHRLDLQGYERGGGGQWTVQVWECDLRV